MESSLPGWLSPTATPPRLLAVAPVLLFDWSIRCRLLRDQPRSDLLGLRREAARDEEGRGGEATGDDEGELVADKIEEMPRRERNDEHGMGRHRHRQHER